MINLNKNLKIKAFIISKTVPLLLPILLLFASCTNKRVIYTPQGYDITKPDVTDLGNKLREISGIFWVNDTFMLANNDEAGRIFRLNPSDKKDFTYPNVKFAEKDDYEDIVKVGSSVFILISTGKILEVRGYHNEDSVTYAVVATVPGEDNEFESLYYDSTANSLIMLCKKCNKEKDKIRTAYRYDLGTRLLADSPYYKISIDLVREKVNDSRQEFQPSAAAINPIQGKLYIVSSIGKLLVIADRNGNVESAFGISPTMFPQPEGMTFSANGDMFISNEAFDDRATLLKFPYNELQK
jgi:hypothetical protein